MEVEVDRSFFLLLRLLLLLMLRNQSSSRLPVSLSLSHASLFLSPQQTLTSRKKSRTLTSEETASSAAAGGVGRRPIWARAARETRISSFF